jgi:hypothetical protein
VRKAVALLFFAHRVITLQVSLLQRALYPHSQKSDSEIVAAHGCLEISFAVCSISNGGSSRQVAFAKILSLQRTISSLPPPLMMYLSQEKNRP